MNYVIAGGSGLIGKALVQELLIRKHSVTVLSRNLHASPRIDQLKFVHWDSRSSGDWCNSLVGADAIINLSGASIAGGLWTDRRKEVLFDSRIQTTRILAEAITQSASPAPVFLNASAVGYYGNTGDSQVTEHSPQGNGFLATLCGHWEREAQKVEARGVRTLLLRTGVVLAKNGGALERMLPPFRFFFGGPLGSGKQWMPWIHLIDVVNTMIFAVESVHFRGPLNLTAPHPVTMHQFAKELGKALRRPSWLPVPTPILTIILGELSSVVVDGQRALPDKLTAAGFPFRFPTIDKALVDILKKQS